MWLFLTVPWVGLQCVIVVFIDHIILLSNVVNCVVFFIKYSCLSPSNKVFSSSSKNSGFVRVADNSGKTGSSPSVTKHYAAISMSLEATAILGTSITASSTLYFQCSLKPCYDDGSGQCGGVSLQCSINPLYTNGFFLLV